MPGITEFEFGSAGGNRPQRKESSPFVMLVLGNFAGNTRDNTRPDPALLMQIPVRQVDIDNIDQLWSVFTPALELDIAGNHVELAPRDLDDFHPDQLFQQLPLFSELRQLRKRLLDPVTSAEALAEVTASGQAAEASDQSAQFTEGDRTQEEAESGNQMFERLLGEHPEQATTTSTPAVSTQSKLDSFLQRVVSPHVVYELDPKAETAVDAVDLAIAASMRNILHHPDFQQLEGAWRTLYDLVQESEIGEELQLKVCNVSKDELLAGLPDSAESMADSGLYQLLVGRFRRAADDDGFSVLLCNYSFGGDANDVALLAIMGALAEEQDAAVIAAAESELIGAYSLAQQPAANEWSKAENPFWSQLRESPVAGRIGLVLPRVLGRLPYGRNAEEIDSFDFEEIHVGNEDASGHESYLWVNPTLACGKLLAKSFTEYGWNMSPDNNTDIGGLPAYSYELDGEQKLMPCAELLLPERSAEAILGLGIMPIVSFRNRDMARLLRFQSVSKPLSALLGPWETHS
ncbi:MAG: type VI secretion system contractile sheath large subunit [Xanthomonadales bacterium]|nr:type VI secretion system contractile sheath large subunit [Xanthomonadales bacterium]